MAQHEPQPEDSATRPLAAAASAAGSYVQTSTYRRAMGQRGQAGRGAQQQPDTPKGQGAADPAAAPDAGFEEFLQSLERPFDEPAPDPAEAGRAPVLDPEVDAPSDFGVELDEVTVACSADDVAAAQARISRAQVEPPTPGTAGPALAPPSL